MSEPEELAFKAYRHAHDTQFTGIIHVIGRDHKILAEAFMRMQEHYESPHDHIRGQIFTVGQVRAAGGRTCPSLNLYEGGNTYDTPWAGYNIPGYILQPFIQGLFDPLIPYEQDIVEVCRYNTLSNIYIIGTITDTEQRNALDHEVCHALYYLNEKYRKEVDAVLKKVNLKQLKKMLVSWGYNTAQLLDECHAYISADYDWLSESASEDMEKYKVSIPKSVHKALRSIKKKHFNDDWMKDT